MIVEASTFIVFEPAAGLTSFRTQDTTCFKILKKACLS